MRHDVEERKTYPSRDFAAMATKPAWPLCFQVHPSKKPEQIGAEGCFWYRYLFFLNDELQIGEHEEDSNSKWCVIGSFQGKPFAVK